MSEFLEIYGAKTHNLKNINLKIPKNKLTVITGVSGSGKSSLAFNTIYSIGQQKYLESLSSYARMFIGKMTEEAEIEEIKGLSPTISIDQKTTNKNPRSTVGTITEIYDYYKVLFLNIGERFCIKCNNIIKKDNIEDIILYLSTYTENTKFTINAKLHLYKNIKLSTNIFTQIKNEVLSLGFIRFKINGNNFTINDNYNTKLDNINIDNVDIIVDRLIIKNYSNVEDSNTKRLKDSLNLAFKIGKGLINIDIVDKKIQKDFSNIFICSNCGHIPEKLSISSFSFNNHSGACPECHGLGIKQIFLEEKIINQNLTLLEGAIIAPGFSGEYFFEFLKEISKTTKVDLYKKWKDLSKKEKDIILYGIKNKIYTINFTNEYGEKKIYKSKYEGVINTLERRYFNGGAEKGIYDNFVVDITCPLCLGHRLKQESLSVKINNTNIGQLSNLPVDKAVYFLNNLKLTKNQERIAKKVLKNAIERLSFLSGVGLNYITISRKAGTLSGGESQRIRLATQIGTKLEGIIYVLDEPSIGLHPRDNQMLINNLKKLRDLGNTLIIVEHDEDIMREADFIVDIGPGAGQNGGNIVALGTSKAIQSNNNSITGPYLKDNRKIFINKGFRPSFKDLKKNGKLLQIFGAKQNNLKNIDISIPLSNLVVVTGVSGSGKSSLVNDILSNYLLNNLNKAKKQVGNVDKITGIEYIDKAIVIDQSPIGKTPRSNPATYTGVFTHIRDVFSFSEESQIRGYTPGHFSFNTKNGKCESCNGDGVKKIEMHFLPPVYVECEVCSGTRYKQEILKVKYKGKNIADILNMTIDEAKEFFINHPKIIKILDTLIKVGLGYIKLGQSSTTLSGGESQRIKLSTELAKRSTGKTFYILDEPTTGLHFKDTQNLLRILHSLVDKGNSVLVIEHNMDVILNADYIIDIGPEGGEKGGNLVVSGTIKEVSNCKNSYTGYAIKKTLKRYKNNI